MEIRDTEPTRRPSQLSENMTAFVNPSFMEVCKIGIRQELNQHSSLVMYQFKLQQTDDSKTVVTVHGKVETEEVCAGEQTDDNLMEDVGLEEATNNTDECVELIDIGE